VAWGKARNEPAESGERRLNPAYQHCGGGCCRWAQFWVLYPGWTGQGLAASNAQKSKTGIQCFPFLRV
jgi:hypothetical protein